jgi:glycosyltransferase involved in cell wall biosynthesis
MRTSPTVSVVIPTFNRRKLLRRVLSPLLATPHAHEIIVVVDGCTDGSFELLSDLAEEDPRVHPLLIANRGMGGARLAGAEAATGEVVLLIDDDVIVGPGTVAGHAAAHARAENLLVVGAMPVAGGLQRDRRDFPRAMYAHEYERHVARWVAEPDSILRTLWAGHLSLRRNDLLSLDPPANREIARGYHSDLDFGLRCERAGLRAVFDPDLSAEHLYERAPAAFITDARSSGRSFALVHAAHEAQIGALERDFTLAGLPAPLRAFVRRARTERWPAGTLRALVPLLGLARWYRAQRFAAGLRWRIEQDRAIAATVAGSGPPGPVIAGVLSDAAPAG